METFKTYKIMNRRIRIVNEIREHCEAIGYNQITLMYLLATMSDKAITKFHIEFMAIVPPT